MRVTRSKKYGGTPPSDIDELGNVSGLIDYDCDEPVDKKELYEEIHRLSKGRITMHLPP